MKAIVCTKYGPPDGLRLSEVDKPTPRDNEVLVKIHATTVTSSDCIVRGFKLPLSMWIPGRIALGLRAPRKPILGVELAGEVEAIGKRVKRFRVGDRVFAFTGRGGFGAYAEYTCVPEGGLVAMMPDGVTYDVARLVRTPVLVQHGIDDEVVPEFFATDLASMLRGSGVEVTLQRLAAGHSITPEGLAAARLWLDGHLDGSPQD